MLANESAIRQNATEGLSSLRAPGNTTPSKIFWASSMAALTSITDHRHRSLRSESWRYVGA